MEKPTVYEELATELLTSKEFRQLYEWLLKLQYPESTTKELGFDEIKFLLKAASIFAFSNEDHKKIAYKIATIISEKCSGKYKGINAAVQYIIISSGQMPALLKNIDDCKKDYFSTYSESGIPFNPIAYKNIILKQASNKAPEKERGKDIFFTDFQRESFVRLRNGESISISAPTSAGKSFLLISYLALKFRESKIFNVAYLVPTRALIAQVQRDMKKGLMGFSITDVLVTSTSNIAKENKKFKKLFVFTQERMYNMLFDTGFDEPFDVLIIDEAQKVSDVSRGILLEEVIEETIERNRKKNHDLQKLFISPFAKNPEKYAEIFNLKDLRSTKTKLSPVSQNLLEINIGDYEYKLDIIDVEFEKERVAIEKGKITDKEKELFLKSDDWKLLWAAQRYGSDSNIIYCNTQRATVNNAIIFSQRCSKVDDKEINQVIKFLKENVHAEYFLIRCLERGVGYHYGSMPVQIRELVESLFRKKKIRYIFCTSTLLEGVNLPAKNIFISNPRQGKVGMTQLNFWNLAGRAGRLLKDYYGNIFCINIEQWPGYKPNPADTEHTIESILETTIKDKQIIEYLRNVYKAAKAENAATEQAITKFIIQEIKGEGHAFIEKLTGRKLDLEHLQGIQREIKGLAKMIQIPADVIQKNLSINPLKQQKLLEKFKESPPPLPLHPNQPGFYQSLENIYKLVDEYFDKPSDRYRYFAFLTNKWINGGTVGELVGYSLQQDIKSNVKPTAEMINNAIDRVFRNIDNELRYKYQNYVKCYIDLLYLFYKDNDKLAGINESLPLYLEFGTYKKNVLVMQAMGLSRSTALMLNKFTKESEFVNQTDCSEWFKLNKETLKKEMPEFVWEEINEII